jgi:hypothetical protein
MLAIGQRYFWKNGNTNSFICEVTDVINHETMNFKIIQIVSGPTYTVGEIFIKEYLNNYYTYLEGQDAPSC